MGFKEKVQDKIKEDKLRSLWHEICESYEQGGIAQIKASLDSQVDKIKKDYMQQLEDLKKMI